jgi:peptidyl-tRNA hydrolase
MVIYEELEDTKGVIRIRKSKKNRQHNGQKKKDKRTNNDLQNIHIKLKIK